MKVTQITVQFYYTRTRMFLLVLFQFYIVIFVPVKFTQNKDIVQDACINHDNNNNIQMQQQKKKLKSY